MIVNYFSKNNTLRVLFALLVHTFVSLTNTAVFAQQQHSVTLTVTNQDLKSVLDAVEKKTVYRFNYRDQILPRSNNVTIKAENMKIEDFLKKILANATLTYRRNGNMFSIISRPTKAETQSQQSDIIVHGLILGENRQPLSGASITVKGTSHSTISNEQGLFSLSCRPESTLVASHIGHVPQEVALGGDDEVSITLLPNDQVLDEVVIVGYGTQKRSNVTGSVASLRPADFNDLNMNATNAIQGRVAGVNVSNGNIIIRGAASVNGSDPLWIVDGVPGTAPNMNDVESLEILKDAASTAIYGAQGAGGVILVTTKRGRAGKPVVNARYNAGIALPIDIPKLLQTPDYIDRKLAAGFTNNPDAGWDDPSSLPNTDWEEYVWRNAAVSQNVFVQATGGSEHTNYNTSGEFVRNQRIEQGSYDMAGNLRFSSQTKFSNRFKMTEILTLGFTDRAPSVFGDETSSKIYYRQVPTMTPYDPANVTGGGWGMQPPGGYYEGPNPAAIIGSNHYNQRGYKGGANVIFDWDIIDGLALQTTLTGRYNSSASNWFQEYWNTGNISQEQRYTKDYGEEFHLRMLHTLTYSKTFAENHNFKILAGYEASKTESSSAGGWKTGFSVEPVQDMSLGSGATEALGGKGLRRSLSQFARLNYAYQDKYLFETSIRRDGYDNFGAENRFGLFPSASAGWNIAEESFIKNSTQMQWLNQLKLRGSLGRIGNNTIPQFLYEPAYTSNYLYYAYNNLVTSRGFWFSNIPNAAIKWEDVMQWNVGLDAGFLQNRLQTTVEYYHKNTTDMLYTISAPPSSGAYSSDIFALSPSYVANIGEISNKGFELMVQWKDAIQDFKYDIAFTLSTNDNKVIKLSDQVNPLIWTGNSTAINSSIYRTENGFPMGQMYGYIVDGIFQHQAAVDQLNAASPDGVYQTTGTAPGDFKYRDLDGDNKITVDDRAYIGNPWPKAIYGMNINLRWKGFDLSMAWLAHTGMDIFNSAKAYERNFFGDFNTTYKVYDAWTPENTQTEHPRVTQTDPNNNFRNVSSYFVEDGSFLKLNNLHFGYNIPKNVLSPLGVQGLKVYVNCDNIMTITRFQGDPEIGGGYLSRNHYSEKRYPNTRSVIAGLNLTF